MTNALLSANPKDWVVDGKLVSPPIVQTSPNSTVNGELMPNEFKNIIELFSKDACDATPAARLTPGAFRIDTHYMLGTSMHMQNGMSLHISAPYMRIEKLTVCGDLAQFIEKLSNLLLRISCQDPNIRGFLYVCGDDDALAKVCEAKGYKKDNGPVTAYRHDFMDASLFSYSVAMAQRDKDREKQGMTSPAPMASSATKPVIAPAAPFHYNMDAAADTPADAETVSEDQPAEAEPQAAEETADTADSGADKTAYISEDEAAAVQASA